MRGLAAFSVLVFHATFPFRPPTGIWQYLSQRNAGPPITGVVVFFLISGFVLYRPFVEARLDGNRMPSLLPYAVRRVARIVPAYWVALAVVTVWLGLHEVQTPAGAVRYFGFLQLYGSFNTANGGISPAWTLCVEITFYAALPLLALAVRRVSASRFITTRSIEPRSIVSSELALCAAMVVTSLIWQTVVCAAVPLSSGWRVTLLWTLPGSLDLFAAGMALAIVSAAVERRSTPPRWLAVVDRMPWLPWLLAIGVFYGVGRVPDLGRYGFAAWWIPSHELKAIGAALLLVPLIFGSPARGWLRRIVGWRPLVWLGGISYAIYLWHKPLLEKLLPHVAGHGELVTTLVLAVATTVIAAVSFYAIERPAQRMARRFLRWRTYDAKRAGQPVTSPETATMLAELHD
jgi:peptidoglycan/LPS O-acetylase OafA/YrhL